jgi:hypothetical protein
VPPAGELAERQHPSPYLQRIWRDAARVRHGRVSRYCLAHARSPVLAVPPSALSDRAARSLHAWSFRRRPLAVEQARHEWEGQKLSR